MLRVYAGRDEAGPVVHHHRESIFPTLIDGSNLVKVHNAGSPRRLGCGCLPSLDQLGNGSLCQLARDWQPSSRSFSVTVIRSMFSFLTPSPGSQPAGESFLIRVEHGPYKVAFQWALQSAYLFEGVVSGKS